MAILQTTNVTGSLKISSSNLQSGSTLFSVDGYSGRLFTIDDTLSGSLFSVAGISGIPVLEVFSDHKVIVSTIGKVGIGITNPVNKLDVLGNISASAITASLAGSVTSASYALSASYAPAGAGVEGGTINYIPLWSGITTLTSSIMLQTQSNIGIGTTTPKNKVDINGAAVIGSVYAGTNTAPANGLLIQGNVGIGLTNPATNLHVNGDISSSTITSSGIFATNTLNFIEQMMTGSVTNPDIIFSSSAQTGSDIMMRLETRAFTGSAVALNIFASGSSPSGSIAISASRGDIIGTVFSGSNFVGTASLALTASIATVNPTVAGQIILTAAGSWPSYSSGSTNSIQVETLTNRVNYYYIEFPNTIKSFANWAMAMPSDYNGGTITAIFYWSTTNISPNAVVWGLDARAFNDGDAIDSAFGTAQEVSDNPSGVDKVYITSATSAITIGGTPSAGSYVQFRAYRDPAAAGDTHPDTIRLLQVRITYTRS